MIGCDTANDCCYKHPENDLQFYSVSVLIPGFGSMYECENRKFLKSNDRLTVFGDFIFVVNRSLSSSCVAK